MTDGTKLAEEIGSGRLRGCPSHSRHGRLFAVLATHFAAPADHVAAPADHVAAPASTAVLAAPAAMQDTSTSPSAAPSKSWTSRPPIQP